MDHAKLIKAVKEAAVAKTTRMSDEENGFFWIRRGNLAAFDKRLELVNRRARKLGVEEMSYKVLAEILVPRIQYLGDSPLCQAGTEEWVVVLPSDLQVKLPGWEFISTVAVFPEGNLILTVPGATEMSEAMSLRVRETKPVCDHCQTKRARKDVFVVRHESGEEKLVGRQCLRDYLGHQDAEKLAKFFDAYASLLGSEDERWGEGEGGFSKGVEGYDTERFLAHVSRQIKLNGWCPRSRAWDGGATADAADLAMLRLDFLGGYGNMSAAERKAWDDENRPTDEDAKIAAETVAWVRDEMEVKSDFDHNLKLMATSAITRVKGMGIAAYAVVAFNKHMERETEKRRQEEGLPAYKDEYLAEIGTRVREVPAQVTFLYTTEGMYGARTLVKMITDEGHIAAWWASTGEPRTKDGDLIEVGSKVRMTATIKKHEVYKEQKQTVVTRAILVARVEEEEAGRVLETAAG